MHATPHSRILTQPSEICPAVMLPFHCGRNAIVKLNTHFLGVVRGALRNGATPTSLLGLNGLLGGFAFWCSGFTVGMVHNLGLHYVVSHFQLGFRQLNA